MNDNFNEDFWWEAIDEYVISEIMEFESNLNDYYSHLQILFIDEHDVENENGGGMRFHKSVSFDNVDELESYVGSEEVKKWKSDFKNLSSEQKSIQHETALYVSNENGYETKAGFEKIFQKSNISYANLALKEEISPFCVLISHPKSFILSRLQSQLQSEIIYRIYQPKYQLVLNSG